LGRADIDGKPQGTICSQGQAEWEGNTQAVVRTEAGKRIGGENLEAGIAEAVGEEVRPNIVEHGEDNMLARPGFEVPRDAHHLAHALVHKLDSSARSRQFPGSMTAPTTAGVLIFLDFDRATDWAHESALAGLFPQKYAPDPSQS